MKDPDLIYPGDPRHPCPVCGGRKRALHVRPCAPVPLRKAHQSDVTMIERVARALFERHDSRAGQPSWEREVRWEVAKLLYIDDARAVVRVMREPTEVMIDAGNRSDDFSPIGDAAVGGWTTMIDAALLDAA